MPDKLRIHAVIVVPTLAPIIIPIACDSFMIPEFTKPTTMTVVADEDWITAVTKAPSSTALIGFEVSRSKILSSLPPDIFVSPSPIVFIPYKNRARPPSIVRTSKIFIPSLLSTSHYLLPILPNSFNPSHSAALFKIDSDPKIKSPCSSPPLASFSHFFPPRSTASCIEVHATACPRICSASFSAGKPRPVGGVTVYT